MKVYLHVSKQQNIYLRNFGKLHNMASRYSCIEHKKLILIKNYNNFT